MTIIDRHIIARFLWNFIILFLLLFIFAVAIDLIMKLDDFVDRARAVAGNGAGFFGQAWAIVWLVFDFEGPRVFQFYAYLHGLVAIGAMGFTLAQMHRHRELVAVMASGVSLLRIAMPFVVAVFALSLVQLVNQELILPTVAPLLLREYGQIGQHAVANFEVRFTADNHGGLLQAPSFDPNTLTLTWPTFIERNDRGISTRRIAADLAVWDEAAKIWKLTNARAFSLREPTGSSGASATESAFDNTPAPSAAESVDSYATDITPQVLIVRRHSQYASMLSMEQIREMLRTPGVTDEGALKRHLYARFAGVLVNFLVLLIALPSFLLREPANLLMQSLSCAMLSIPAMIGAAIGMMVQLPGIAPAVAVFLPVLVLIPVAFARVSAIRT